MNKSGQSEALFIVKAFEKGWEIAKPFHHAQPYDFVIKKNEKWQTVQVKSAYQEKDSRGNRYRIIVRLGKTKGRGKTPYQVGDFDLLVIVYEKRIWLMDWKEMSHISSKMVMGHKYDKFIT